MSNKLRPQSNCSEPVVYQIRIKDHLDSQWKDWFEGMTIATDDDGTTLLSGTVADQSALYGLIRKIRDLGISLISVNRVSPD
jgi:hypothetical protein